MSIDFKIEESNVIQGLWIIEPSIAEDLRGNIWTSFMKEEIEKLIPNNIIFRARKFVMPENQIIRY